MFPITRSEKSLNHFRLESIEGPKREPKASKFTQQELYAFRPVLSPYNVIITYLLVCAVFTLLGAICLQDSNKVVEQRERYDDAGNCSLTRRSSNGEDTEKGEESSDSNECTLHMNIKKTMEKPIYVYYELDDYYQNHRRYVKSRNDHQLANRKGGSLDDCKPKATINKTLPGVSSKTNVINPCGLIAWSYFNDTFEIRRSSQNEDIDMEEDGIAWKQDKKYKFGDYSPENFNIEASYIGGGQINGNILEDEHFIVWMRVAALPRFRKLYGIIDDETLEKDDSINITIENNYNTSKFGKKFIVLSTTSRIIGGKSKFLGLLQIALGFACFFAGLLYFILHVKFPRKLGDQRFLSWVD
eukprot:g7911.t1